MFEPGTQPSLDASDYPPLETLVVMHKKLRAKNVATLSMMDDAAHDRTPRHVPPGFESSMTTIGQTLLLISMHQMLHVGQLSDCRRAAGFKPLM